MVKLKQLDELPQKLSDEIFSKVYISGAQRPAKMLRAVISTK